MTDLKDYKLESVYSCNYCQYFERMTGKMEDHLKEKHGIENPRIYLTEDQQ